MKKVIQEYMCLYPRLIQNPKYKKNKKNQGEVPQLTDTRVGLVPVGCGKCMECLKQKAMHWKIRLLEEIQNWKRGEKWFVTMTFSEEALRQLEANVDIDLTGYRRDNEVAIMAVREWTEAWRSKRIEGVRRKAIRHWLVTELGQTETERIHLHGIIFDKDIKTAIECWKFGRMTIGNGHGTHYVNETTVGYIVKYLMKADPVHKEYTPKVLCSKGIGATYINAQTINRHVYRAGTTKEEYKNRQGFKMSMPPYYRNKLYTEEQREKLWIEKLNKDERWVNGMRIQNASDNKESYENRLRVAREKNKRLGYGEAKDWDRRQYEDRLRDIKAEQRRQIGV